MLTNMKPPRNQWRDPSVGMVLGITQHNIHTQAVWGAVSLSVLVPSTSVVGSSRNITRGSESATEGGEPVAQPITDPHASEPIELHVGRLLRSQEGIGDQLVLVEDRVIVAGHVCFDRPHALIGDGTP